MYPHSPGSISEHSFQATGHKKHDWRDATDSGSWLSAALISYRTDTQFLSNFCSETTQSEDKWERLTPWSGESLDSKRGCKLTLICEMVTWQVVFSREGWSVGTEWENKQGYPWSQKVRHEGRCKAAKCFICQSNVYFWEEWAQDRIGQAFWPALLNTYATQTHSHANTDCFCLSLSLLLYIQALYQSLSYCALTHF